MSARVLFALAAVVAVGLAAPHEHEHDASDPHGGHDHSFCQDRCGTKEEIIAADEDKDAKVWSDDCHSCYVEHCETNPEDIHCERGDTCEASWDSCREKGTDAVPSWMSPKCCSWSKCACAIHAEHWCDKFADCEEE